MPIISNGNKYIYSNLPKVIGVNPLDKTLITWNDESYTTECTSSTIIQCKKIPALIPLSTTSCLSQLFNDNQLVTSMCQVSRSQDIDQDVLLIDNGIWLFYNIRQTRDCHVYSSSNEISETISITEPTLLRIQCNKTVTCMDIQLPASSCTQHRLILTPNLNSYIQNLPSFNVPLRNMNTTLVSSYQLQLEKKIKDMMPFIIPTQSILMQLIHEGGSYVFTLIVLLILLSIIKCIKSKFQRENDDMHDFVLDTLTV